MNQELWITGAGMVTSVGSNKNECYTAFCNGVSGVGELQAFDIEKFNSKHAYEIKDRVNGEEPLRSTRWLCAAIIEAAEQSQIGADITNVAVLVGTGLRELRTVELHFTDNSAFNLNQLHFGTLVRERLANSGPVYTVSNACAASNYSLALAEDMLRLGQAEIVCVAGCDTLTESMYGLLGRVNPMVPERLQSFDRNRKGVLMGEGAAALILETADHARRRGAKPLARLRAVGLSCDATHETAPDREGIERAIRDAHLRSGIFPNDVDVIFVHGTGTSLNDSTEAAALATVFDPAEKPVVLSGLKSMTGHTSGASGLVGVVTAMLALEHKHIPPTVGLEDPIDEVAGMNISAELMTLPELRIAQINAFGFGGVNSVVMLEGVVS